MDPRAPLEKIYNQYNNKKYVDPDPLLFLYDYPEKRDREIAGLVASSLAYGRVAQIMKAVGSVLEKMGPSPYQYLLTRKKKQMHKDFNGFVYRFAKQDHLVNLLWETGKIIKGFGSIESCFAIGMQNTSDAVSDVSDMSNISLGLCFFYGQIRTPEKLGHLLANPQKNSACKRSHLFLRWMVRQDAVDPGGWRKIPPSCLMIPLDTHMYKIGSFLGFTARKNMDWKTAEQITDGFRKIIPHDPVKFDFCLTRFGIRQSLDMDQLKTALFN